MFACRILLFVVLALVSAATAGEPPPRVDRFGDALPSGAISRLGTIQLRHAGVAALAFGADGDLVTCGADRTIRIWDPATGRQRSEFPAPNWGSQTPRLLSLSPDGRFLAYLKPAESERRWEGLALWVVESRRPLRMLAVDIPMEGSWSLGISPNGRTLAIASSGMDRSPAGPVQVYDVETGNRRVFGDASFEVRHLLFSPDALQLLASQSLGHSRLWDVQTGQEITRYRLPQCSVICFAPDGKTLIHELGMVGDYRRKIGFRNALTGEKSADDQGLFENGIEFIRYAPDGKTLVFGTSAGLVFWDSNAGKEVRKLNGDLTTHIAFGPGGRYVAGATATEHYSVRSVAVRIWDSTNGRAILSESEDRGHLGEVSSLVLSPDGGRVVSASQCDRSVRLWNLAEGRELWKFQPDKGFFRGKSMVWSPDGRQIAFGTNFFVHMLDGDTGRVIKKLEVSPNQYPPTYWMGPLRFSEDGRTLSCLCSTAVHVDAENPAGNKWVIFTWDLATGKRSESAIRGGGLGEIREAVYSPDGRLAFVPNSLTPLIDAQRGNPAIRLQGEQWRQSPGVFSGNGSLLATWFHDPQNINEPMARSIVQVNETATGRTILELRMLYVRQLAFGPSGRTLSTLSHDGTLTLWDISTGRELVRRTTSPVGDFGGALRIAPDGRSALTGNADSTIMQWNLDHTMPALPAVTSADAAVLWDDLASEDTSRAWKAIWRLAANPGVATTAITSRLRPATPLDKDQLVRLRAELEASKFAMRERAETELGQIGPQSEPVLRQWLSERPSPELRQRIERLLDKLPAWVPPPEIIREIRAVHVLEQIDSDDSRALLIRLAAGAAEHSLTQESQSALARLVKR